MLIVIETSPSGAVISTYSCADSGAVVSTYSCADGIDDAINYVAHRLSHPEEDAAAIADVLADVWRDCVAAASDMDLDPESLVVWNRPGRSSRFGLMVLR